MKKGEAQAAKDFRQCVAIKLLTRLRAVFLLCPFDQLFGFILFLECHALRLKRTSTGLATAPACAATRSSIPVITPRIYILCLLVR